MSLADQQQLEQDYMLHTYRRKPVQFISGSGMTLTDDEGSTYLDFIAGIGAVSMGHDHPAVTRAIQEQAARLLHVGNYFYIEGRGELAQKLSQLLNAARSDGDAVPWRTFFANSGAEANEGAIKLARRHGALNLGGAHTIISAKRSFHGRTLASLAATAQPSKQEAFKPLPAGFVHVELNDIAALVAELEQPSAGAVCAVILECIQGEGGVNPCSLEYLQAVRTQTQDRNILLIIDEVQTGFYRTGGQPFAFQHYGIMPDIVSLAKGLGNGMPIGAVSARGEVGDCFEPGDHGSTFGGSALAVAAANATIDAMTQQGIAQQVIEVGAYLQQELEKLPLVTEIRGRGLMLAVELSKPVAGQVVDACLGQGLVINNTGPSTLRFLPPLICTTTEIDLMIPVLHDILSVL